ncbi:MAG: nucleotide exchange factor GrpE [Lentisphaeria bacterium]|nr:nucleotide exchange factor GrpE [Lentisphaeria bacterium]
MKNDKDKEKAVQDNENTSANEVKEETAPETEKNEDKAPEAEEKKSADPAAELAALQEKYIYLQAEYQNYRKRMAKEIADSRRFAVEDTVQPFMTVYDFLAMAETAANQSDNVEAIRQGLIMIIGEYRKAFDELGLKPFDAKGEKFDPELHDAVAREVSDEIPEGVVVKQWNCGFKLGEKVIRPARVVVSSGAAAEEEKKEE